MPAPFPKPRSVQDDITTLFDLDRARSTARPLGHSTLAPGDGWIGVTDGNDEVARVGESGLWVPDGGGGWILVQVDAQRRADTARDAAITTAAADATSKANAARDQAITTAAADATAKADAARNTAITTASADATSKADAARVAAIATAAADATAKANAAIAHSDSVDAGQNILIASVTSTTQQIADWLGTYFGYPGPPT